MTAEPTYETKRYLLSVWVPMVAAIYRDGQKEIVLDSLHEAMKLWGWTMDKDDLEDKLQTIKDAVKCERKNVELTIGENSSLYYF